MKYYSTELKKFFDSVEDCEAAEAKDKEEKERLEKEREEKLSQREARAKEVDEAYREYVAAKKKYKELWVAFLNDYHKYHKTYTDKDADISLWDILDSWFR